MDRYKCERCGELVSTDITTIGGIQCEKCGSKIIFKERPNIKKTITAR